jgi:hypothetical protein
MAWKRIIASDFKKRTSPVLVSQARVPVRPLEPTVLRAFMVRATPSTTIIPPTKRGKSAGETNQTFCTPPQESFMGILSAWPTTQRPNRLIMTPEKISALRSFSISSMEINPW